MKKIIKILVTLAAIMGVFSLVSCNNDSSNAGGGKRIWIKNMSYSSNQASFMAMPTTDVLIQTIEQFTIEVSPAGAVQFIEGEREGNGSAWKEPITIGGGGVIYFSAKYKDPDDDQKVTITVTAMNSDENVVVSDTWSGKLSEKGENFRNGILSDTL